MISIVICTANRAEDLRQTLCSLEQVRLPDNLPCELLVVDNASTDHTAEVARSWRLPHLPVRYIPEPRRGLSHARNTGVTAARGEIILFTDDDVRVPRDWIEKTGSPILSGKADAVAGAVEIAPHLKRPWMTPAHRIRLADTAGIDPDDPDRMVGANMAFSRKVLTKVPRFDTELGAGTIYTGEETLFTAQLKQADFGVVSAFDSPVIHHFDAARLTRASFLDQARRNGREAAYLAHHWRHVPVENRGRDFAKHLYWLARLRMTQWRRGAEPVSEWELILVTEIWKYRQYLVERRHPRKYDKHGLVKRMQG